MSSEFGRILHVSIFGQSHGQAIGVVLDGLPAGEKIDMDALHTFLARRRPGQSALSTARNETDTPIFLSGLVNDITCGTPLCAVIENRDQRSKDYQALLDTPRPSHADYTAYVKWKGYADMRGGGHFSGRLTAPLCIAGGIARQILARRHINIGAHLASVGEIQDAAFPLEPHRELLKALGEKPFPVLDDEAGARMQELIVQARQNQDSVGGVISCAVTGLPAGLGDPMFDGVENRLASILFGIPAVKGVEFGDGFASARRFGSENNDAFVIQNQEIKTRSNHAGGILGGITTGMPLIFQVAIKPTPSIGQKQDSISLSRREAAELRIPGRHDPCIAHRAVPVVEAVAALVCLDMILEGNHGIICI